MCREPEMRAPSEAECARTPPYRHETGHFVSAIAISLPPSRRVPVGTLPVAAVDGGFSVAFHTSILRMTE